MPTPVLYDQLQAEAIAQRHRRYRHLPLVQLRWPRGSKVKADVELRQRCEWMWDAAQEQAAQASDPDRTPDPGVYGGQLFATHFFPHIFDLPFNAVHTDYYQLRHDRAGARGQRDAVAAPRGHSKTTGCALLTILHAGCYPKEESFILYITNSADNAEEKVRQVRDELEDNAEVTRVFGPRRGNPWNQHHWRTVDRTTVLAVGRLSQVRGATQQFRRPSLILADDIEHPEQVLSELQRVRTQRWWENDILKLGDAKTNVELSGTILHPHSLLRTILDGAGWHTRFYQAVTRFASPDSVPLWQEWRTVFLDRTNPRRQDDAQAFFAAHRQAMLADAAVLWAARKDYYALMVERLVEGESGFWQELQNLPLGDQRYLFDMDAAHYVRLLPDGIQRGDGRFVPWLAIQDVAAYYDPALGRGKDCAACVVGCKDQAGYEYVLDAYVTNTESPDEQCAAIAALLWKWQVGLLGLEVNGFQSLLSRNVREAIAAHARAVGQPWHVQLVPITHTSNKILRIKTLEPLVSNGWLQFAQTLPSEFFRQFTEFLPLPDAGRDDCLDASEGMLSTLRGIWRKQDAS
jgi:hypothetical protein